MDAATDISGLCPAPAIISKLSPFPDEYGIPGPNNIGRFQYTGQAWIPELGMYSYKARIYSPSLGRFLQTDPAGYVNGPNWYNYAGADPINNTDPSGGYLVPNEALPYKVGCSMHDMFCYENPPTDGDQVTVTGTRPPMDPGTVESLMQQFAPQEGAATGGAEGAIAAQNSCVRTNGLPATCGVPPRPLRSKSYICSKLANNGYRFAPAFDEANDDRHKYVNGVFNWTNNDIMREGENWLYAARDGVDPLAITLRQAGKIFRGFWNTTPISYEAWIAGLQGGLHHNDTVDQVREWCSAK